MSAPYPILVINCGSSSLKFSVLEPEAEAVLASGIAERLVTGGIGENNAAIRAQVLTHLVFHPELDQKLNEVHGKGADGRITRGIGLVVTSSPQTKS